MLPTEASASLREAVARLLNSLPAEAARDAAAGGTLLAVTLPEARAWNKGEERVPGTLLPPLPWIVGAGLIRF